MIISFFRRLWNACPLGCTLVIAELVLITVIFVITFTNVWPSAHDWFNSTPCPHGCGLVQPWWSR